MAGATARERRGLVRSLAKLWLRAEESGQAGSICVCHLRALPELTPLPQRLWGPGGCFWQTGSVPGMTPPGMLRYPGCSLDLPPGCTLMPQRWKVGCGWGQGQAEVRCPSTSAHLRCYMNKQNLCVIALAPRCYMNKQNLASSHFQEMQLQLRGGLACGWI